MSNYSSSSRFVLGTFLILVGIFIFLMQHDFFFWEDFWPVILIGIGILFVVGFLLNTNNYGLLMPASILLVIGTLFLYMEMTHWNHIIELWPTFILAPGIGFIFMFLFGPSGNKLYIPGLILITIAAIFFVSFSSYSHYWPVILIILGLVLIFTPKKDTKKSEEKSI